MIVCAISPHEVRRMNDKFSQRRTISVVCSYKTSKLLIREIIALFLIFLLFAQITSKTNNDIELEFLSDYLERIVYFTQG
jgi:hypothetical protein